jgi:hypothetical protein
VPFEVHFHAAAAKEQEFDAQEDGKYTTKQRDMQKILWNSCHLVMLEIISTLTD